MFACSTVIADKPLRGDQPQSILTCCQSRLSTVQPCRTASRCSSQLNLPGYPPFHVQIKTTASTTYRVWPNSGVLEAGETARVQVLLLGSKVDLGDFGRVEECCRDRFQVS